MIFTINNAHTPSAAQAQMSVESIWLMKIAEALSASVMKRFGLPNTTSHRPSINSGRKTIAVISPSAQRV